MQKDIAESAADTQWSIYTIMSSDLIGLISAAARVLGGGMSQQPNINQRVSVYGGGGVGGGGPDGVKSVGNSLSSPRHLGKYTRRLITSGIKL